MAANSCGSGSQTSEAAAVDTEVEMKQAAAELREEAGLPPSAGAEVQAEQKEVELVRRTGIRITAIIDGWSVHGAQPSSGP